MPRLDRLPQINRSNLLTFPAQVNETAPFAPLGRANDPDLQHRVLGATLDLLSEPADRCADDLKALCFEED